MSLKARIAGALLACAVLSGCQGGGSSSTGNPSVPSAGPAPTGVQQCQAPTPHTVPLTTVATPSAPPASGTIQTSLVLVPEGQGSLGVYLRNPWTGALVDRGYVPTGEVPSAVATSQGRYVYVANKNHGTISQYEWHPSTAQLVSLAANTTSGAGTSSLATIGDFLYALNANNNTLSTFQIGSNGILVFMTSITTPALTSLAAGANGMLYGLGANEIVSFGAGTSTPRITASTPVSGLISGATNGLGPLYVLTDSAVTAYNVSGGTLGVQDSVPLPSGLTPTALAVGVSQLDVVGTGSGGSEVATFPLVSGGIACPTSAVWGPSGEASGAALSPGGHYVYVANGTRGDLLAYTATTSGSGPQLSGDLRTRLSPQAVTSLVANVVVAPQILYVIDQSQNAVAGYAIASNGALSTTVATVQSTCSSSCPTAESGPSAFAIAPDGRQLYVTDWAQAGQGDVAAFRIGANGDLGVPNSVAAGMSPMGVAVDPSNRYLYVANSYYINGDGNITSDTGNGTDGLDDGSNGQGTIYGYGLSTGSPTPLPQESTNTGPYPMLLTIDPTGRFLYVSEYAANSIGMFSIDSGTGALATLGSIGSGANPWTVVVGPAGRHVYVSDNGSNVSIYRIDAATGALSPASTQALTVPGNPLGLAMGPKGRRLYVATQGGTVDVFVRSEPLATPSSWAPAPISLIGTFTNAYGLAIGNNGKALYVVDNCSGNSTANGNVQELAIPAFSAGLSAANYASLGSVNTGACTVQALAGGDLG